MTRLVSRAESWEKVYTAFANINFAAFDYNSVKQSIIEYIKLYFPESFDDYIESSELIALVESFAYIAELMAYRIDVVGHENFLSTAQRRDSILKIAKMLSYKVSRAIPARGLAKITSVSTTETLYDASGINLANKTIRWNDSANASWKEQFVQIVDRILEQDFGTVVASDRFQFQDVLFELYQMDTSVNVMPFNASAYGETYPMEVVPVASHDGGIIERRPQQNAQFSLLYGSDGLGDTSDTTGFFVYVKQGSLQRFTATFDGTTPNQVFDLPVSDVNDTDVWVNNVDEITGDVIIKSPVDVLKQTSTSKYGEWIPVDVGHSQNVLFNTNPKRNKYEIETTGSNGVRVIFGDGEFSDIPSGLFEFWVRQSVNEDVVIPQTSVVDVPISFDYLDAYNQTQTFTFTITLINSLTNASAAESTEHVRRTAPAVYYTQDRMVNGQDYNTYLTQDPSILKLRAVNRTFAGDSRYITWHDSSNTYENVKLYGDDGALYIKDADVSLTTPSVTTTALISAYVEPLLSSTDVFLKLVTSGVSPTSLRRQFSASEISNLTAALTPPPSLRRADMYYNTLLNQWFSVKTDSNVYTDLVHGGYQTVMLNGNAQTRDTPISFITSPPYTFDIIDQVGGTPITVTITVQPLTYGELIDEINLQLALTDLTIDIASGGHLQFSHTIDTITPSDSYVEVVSDALFDQINIYPATPVIATPVTGYAYPSNYILDPIIKIRQVNELDTIYTVTRNSRRIIFESPSTLFWSTNDSNTVYNYDRLDVGVDRDTITVLQANTNCNRDGVLQQLWKYDVLGQEQTTQGSDSGSSDIHKLSVLSQDVNNDGVPDYLSLTDTTNYLGLSDIINPKKQYTIPALQSVTIKLPTQYLVGFGDIQLKTTSGTTIASPVFEGVDGTPTAVGSFGTQVATTTSGIKWEEVDISSNLLKYGQPTSYVKISNENASAVDVTLIANEHVYSMRPSVSDEWAMITPSSENMIAFANDFISNHFKVNSGVVYEASSDVIDNYEFARTCTRYIGRSSLNFLWMHFSPRYQLVDPSPTNIIDMFVITRGYFTSFKRWLEDSSTLKPADVTPFSLRSDYATLLNNKMISDTVVLHPGKIKLLFGDKAHPALRGKIKVVKSSTCTLTDNQIKNRVVATVRNFFDIAAFEFGETFYFTELAAAIHVDLPTDISSVVLVPTQQTSQFGDLMQISAKEDEILYPDISSEDVELVSSLTTTNMRLNG